MDVLLGQVGVLAIEHSLMVEVHLESMPTGNAADSYPSPKILGSESGNPPPNPK